MSDQPDTCPVCGSSWIGDEIPVESLHHYGGATHYRRCIGIYDIYRDERVAYACPDCNAVFDRWTGRRIHLQPKAQRLN